jgi:hypothetical protein
MYLFLQFLLLLLDLHFEWMITNFLLTLFFQEIADRTHVLNRFLNWFVFLRIVRIWFTFNSSIFTKNVHFFNLFMRYLNDVDDFILAILLSQPINFSVFGVSLLNITIFWIFAFRFHVLLQKNRVPLQFLIQRFLAQNFRQIDDIVALFLLVAQSWLRLRTSFFRMEDSLNWHWLSISSSILFFNFLWFLWSFNIQIN